MRRCERHEVAREISQSVEAEEENKACFIVLFSLLQFAF